MDVLTWNIRHGGSKKRFVSIVHNLIQHNSDVIVLTEYREEKGSFLRSELGQAGWTFQISSKPLPKTNGIFIASKEPFDLVETRNAPGAKHRWLELFFTTWNLTVLAIHIPNANEKWGKRGFWEAVKDYASGNKDRRVLIIGDFNTGLNIDAEGTPFTLSKYMEELINIGWVDSWRQLHNDTKDFTWYSNKGNGFRLDYGFISPVLKNKLLSAKLSHSERQRGFSDHSSLIVSLDCGSRPNII